MILEEQINHEIHMKIAFGSEIIIGCAVFTRLIFES